MKRVTASEARRHWFRLLDEVAAGEVVVIERKGRRILLKREARARHAAPAPPSYGGLIAAAAADGADEWLWEWTEDDGLRVRDAGAP